MKFWEIAKLELKRIVRDTNWTVSQLILPILVFSAMYLAMPLFIAQITNNPQDLGGRIAISGNYSALFTQLLTERGFELKPVPDALVSLSRKEADVGIVGIRPVLDAQNLGEYRLYTKGSRFASALTAQKLQTALRDINIELLARAAKVSYATINAVKPVFVNVDSAAESAAGGFGFVAVALILSLIALQSGAIGTEVTAQTYERGEFTSQLAAPIRDHEFVLVRLVVCVVTVACLTAWNLVVYQVVGWVRPLLLSSGFIAERGINFGSGGLGTPEMIAGTVALSAANILAFSSVAILIGILFRSAKSSNNFYGPLSILPGIVTLAPFFDNFTSVPDAVFAVPLLGGILAQHRLLLSDLGVFPFALSVGVQLLSAAMIAMIAARNLRATASERR